MPFTRHNILDENVNLKLCFVERVKNLPLLVILSMIIVKIKQSSDSPVSACTVLSAIIYRLLYVMINMMPPQS